MDISIVADERIKENMADTRLQCPAWVRVLHTCSHMQWVPAPCADPTCGVCQKIWAGRMRRRWLPVLEGMQRPKLITLTIPSGFDLAERVDYMSRTFRRFLDTRLGAHNWPKFEAQAVAFFRSFLDEHEPDERIRKDRLGAGVKLLDTFARKLARFERDMGRSARMRDVIGYGFSSPDLTWSGVHGWHLHKHLTVDSWFIPWHLLVVVWVSAGGGPVVDIRALGKDYKSMCEAVKYLTKFWEIPEDRRDEVRAALKGKKKIWGLGGAAPAPIDHTCPGCGRPECQVEQFRLGQTFRRWQDGDTEYMRVLLYGVFDEADAWVTLARVGGRWCEISPYLDTHVVCVPNGRARDGPDPPVGAFPAGSEQLGLWLDDTLGPVAGSWV